MLLQSPFAYGLKVVVTALVVVAIVELAKRSSFWGAVLASLPVTAILAFVWLYVETGNTAAVAKLSSNIFWLIVASSPLFLLMRVLLQTGWPFWWCLAASLAVTVGAYLAIIRWLELAG